LPQKTLVSCCVLAAPEPKISKDRITALACANATGSYLLSMLVIGKSKKPRFKHINVCNAYRLDFAKECLNG